MGKKIGDSASVAAITADASGNVYITGMFNGTIDFNPDAGTFNVSTINSREAMYILKLSSSGTFEWAKTIVLTGLSLLPCRVTAITVDAASNVYTTGSFNESVDFDPGAGIFLCQLLVRPITMTHLF
ncbi:MAG: hypothetical protein IPO27_03135 [Bacteroidetes bacterium]|nr:hypothetical protein [Bacteroidota bacterium]